MCVRSQFLVLLRSFYESMDWTSQVDHQCVGRLFLELCMLSDLEWIYG